MLEHTYEIVTTWSGARSGPTAAYDSYSREYTLTVAGKPPIVGSADKSFRGDASLVNPEEMLVMALSTCHMLSYLAECARSGISVVSYSDIATGKMSLQGKVVRFSSVVLHPRVVVVPSSDLQLAKELHHKAHEACFIANSVSFPVENEAEVVIELSEA